MQGPSVQAGLHRRRLSVEAEDPVDPGSAETGVRLSDGVIERLERVQFAHRAPVPDLGHEIVAEIHHGALHARTQNGVRTEPRAPQEVGPQHHPVGVHRARISWRPAGGAVLPTSPPVAFRRCHGADEHLCAPVLLPGGTEREHAAAYCRHGVRRGACAPDPGSRPGRTGPERDAHVRRARLPGQREHGGQCQWPGRPPPRIDPAQAGSLVD